MRMKTELWSVGLDTDEERAQVIAEDGSHVCYVERDPVLENARLIIAAPKMYRTLKSLLLHKRLGNLHPVDFLRCERVIAEIEEKNVS